MGRYLLADIVLWLEANGCRLESNSLPNGIAFSTKDGLAFSIPVHKGFVDAVLLQDIMTNRWLDYGPCPCSVYP